MTNPVNMKSSSNLGDAARRFVRALGEFSTISQLIYVIVVVSFNKLDYVLRMSNDLSIPHSLTGIWSL